MTAFVSVLAINLLQQPASRHSPVGTIQYLMSLVWLLVSFSLLFSFSYLCHRCSEILDAFVSSSGNKLPYFPGAEDSSICFGFPLPKGIMDLDLSEFKSDRSEVRIGSYSRMSSIYPLAWRMQPRLAITFTFAISVPFIYGEHCLLCSFWIC